MFGPETAYDFQRSLRFDEERWPQSLNLKSKKIVKFKNSFQPKFVTDKTS